MPASLRSSHPVPVTDVARISIAVSERLEDVAEAWAWLEAGHCVLPSQRLGLARAWIESRSIAAKDCVFVLLSAEDEPLAILPLIRQRAYGIRLATWFYGLHLGSYAPLMNRARWDAIESSEQVRLWRQALALIPDCDIVHLHDVPGHLVEATGLAEALEARVQADSVHVARYADWAACDAKRRDKHRRKVDRQQGNKLAARGEVSFEIVGPGPEADGLIDTMFWQRAERFRVQGIRDPFRCETIKRFYKRALAEAAGELHVLRLDGDAIAVRYNLLAGGGIYSLITSMHPSPDLQAGSPGKQNLLRVMQAAFDAGHGFVDMGKGESEEKRLWCNEAVPLLSFNRPLTPAGRLAAAGFAVGEKAKGSIKSRRELFDMYRKLRGRVGRWGS